MSVLLAGYLMRLGAAGLMCATGVGFASITAFWPLVCGDVVKALYDVLLLAQFRAVPAIDEGEWRTKT